MILIADSRLIAPRNLGFFALLPAWQWRGKFFPFTQALALAVARKPSFGSLWSQAQRCRYRRNVLIGS